MSAQFTTARLSGNVVDNTGSAIPGATVTVKSMDTGYTQTVLSGSAGEYLFPSLPVGSYQLSVTMADFSPYVQQGLALAVNQAATQNVELQLGQVVQRVTVSANSSMVTTESAAVGQLVDQKSVESLPLNGREVQQLVFLIPGAVNVTSQNCGVNCQGGVMPGEQYAKINGGGATGVYYLLDGVDYNDAYISSNLPFPNPDAVQEFNVDTNNMSAVYGNALGGVVNIVTKSGTDQIHGSAFEFLRNYAMDARNYFATSPDPLKQNQFGGAIGGPILKGKLYYFGSYQGTRTNTASNGLVQFVPTAAERQGNFSDILPATQLVDPTTGLPFPNNQIPLSRLSPVALYLLQHIPLPNGPGRQLTFNGSPLVQDTNEYLAKADYTVGKHHLSAHYFQVGYTVPIFIPPSSNILEIDTNPAQKITLKNVSVIDIYTISPNFLLSSYFGYTRQNGTALSNIPFTIADAGANIAQPPSLPGGKGPGFDFNVSGGISISGSHYGAFDRGDQSLREIATWIRGRNSLQFGGEAMRIVLPVQNEYQEDGQFNFSNSLSGDNTADFMLGAASAFTQGGGLYLNFTGINWSAFLQDDWRVNPRLTLSAGLRWDPFFPYKDSLGGLVCFVPGQQSVAFPNAPTGLLFAGSHHDPGCPASSVFNNPWNIGPRVGFAYQATADGKTSIRGGAGYYYEKPETSAFQASVANPPYSPVVNLTDVSVSDPYGSAGATNPFPAGFGPVNPPSTAIFPQDIYLQQVFSRHFRLPQVLTWNLTLERGIGQSWLVRAAYMGSAGFHLSADGAQEQGLLEANPAIYIPGQSTEANAQQRRIYPAFSDVLLFDSEENSNYHALQATLEKRFGKGFSILSNFTWAKTLDDFGPDNQPGNWESNTCSCGRYFDYGPDAGDVNKVFKVSGNYMLPRISSSGYASKLVNGWELTGITTWQSGFPFTVYSDNDNSFSAMGADRADLTVPNVRDALLSGSRSHAQLTQEWFNTADFAPNQIGTFGNTGKNILRGPRYFDTDLALVKNTSIEKISTQFRAESYNAFNHTNFGMPDGGLTDGSFGQITSAQSPRIMQMAFKVVF